MSKRLSFAWLILSISLGGGLPARIGAQPALAAPQPESAVSPPETIHQKFQQRADQLLARNLDDLSVLAEQAHAHWDEAGFNEQMLASLVKAYPAGITAVIVQKRDDRVKAAGTLAESAELRENGRALMRAAARSKSDRMLHEFFLENEFVYGLVRNVGSAKRPEGAAVLLFTPEYFLTNVLRPFAASGTHQFVLLNAEGEFVTSNKPAPFRKRLSEQMKNQPAEGAGAMTWMDAERFNLFTYRFTWEPCQVLDRAWTVLAGGEESGVSGPGEPALSGKWTGAYAVPRNHQVAEAGSGQQEMLILQDSNRIEMMIGRTEPPRMFFGEVVGNDFTASSGPQQVAPETLEGSYDPEIRSIKGTLNEFRNGQQVRTAFYMFKVEWGE